MTRSSPNALRSRWLRALTALAVLLASAAPARAEDTAGVTVLPRNDAGAAARPLIVTSVPVSPPAPAAGAPTAAEAPAAGAPTAAGAPAAGAPTADAQAAQGDAQATPGPTSTDEDRDPRALTAFRARLDPYGSWVEDERYGTVWVPSRAVVGRDFAPYVSSGHWALDTGNNWVWVSDFAFGDVVFHYGRWVWTSYGWSWVPGYQYAPAWVTWRTPTSTYHYVGWAPAPPTFVWIGGYARPWDYPWSYYWVFCPSAFVFAPYPYAYVVTHPIYVRSIARYTRVYHPGSPRASSPSLEAARVPRQAWPTERIAAEPRLRDRAALGAAVRPASVGARVNGPVAAPWGREDRAFRTQPPRVSVPPGRLVPPSRFDAPSRPFLPGASVREASSFPGGATPPHRFDAPSPAFAPSRFDAPGRASTVPLRPQAPAFQPHRFDAPARSFSPTFAPSHSFSPARSYSPPPMHAPAAPRMSPPPMRSPGRH